MLKTLKYGESSMISSIYTREFGLKSFIVQGYRSTRARKRHSYFQPMSNIDIVFYNKDNRDLQKITETSNVYFFKELQTHPIKISLGILIIEIFTSSVKEEEKNERLFEFLKSVLVEIDRQPTKLIHIFLYYLVHLTQFLGFFPRFEIRNGDMPLYFNMMEGVISNRISPQSAHPLMIHLMGAELDNCQELTFDNLEKREIIDLMLRYFQTHVPGFKFPESLHVFGEMFGN